MNFISHALNYPSNYLLMRCSDFLFGSMFLGSVLLFIDDSYRSIFLPILIIGLICLFIVQKFSAREKFSVNLLGLYSEEYLFGFLKSQKAVAIHLDLKNGLKNLSQLTSTQRSAHFLFYALDTIIKTHEDLSEKGRTDIESIYGESIIAKHFDGKIIDDGIKFRPLKSFSYVLVSVIVYFSYDIMYFKKNYNPLRHLRWPVQIEVSRVWLNNEQNMKKLKQLRDRYQRRIISISSK